MTLPCWNARGLGNPRAFKRAQKLIQKVSPDLVFILETKLAGRRAHSFIRRMGFANNNFAKEFRKNTLYQGLLSFEDWARICDLETQRYKLLAIEEH